MYSAIFVTDTKKQIEKKVQGSFSGGGKDLAEHREKGGNCDIDVPFQYLTFFLESDEELEHIRVEYTAGRMTTGEIKRKLIDTIVPIVTAHQDAKKNVTPEMVKAFMTPRRLTF